MDEDLLKEYLVVRNRRMSMYQGGILKSKKMFPDSWTVKDERESNMLKGHLREVRSLYTQLFSSDKKDLIILIKKEKMTSSNAINCVVSCFGSMPRNSLYLNRFGQRDSKDLMCESLNGISLNRQIASLSGGDYYGTSIQTFQSNTLQFGCEDSNCPKWQSL